MEKGGESYIKLKNDISKDINDHPKSMMILKLQRIGLDMTDKKTNKTRAAQTFLYFGAV